MHKLNVGAVVLFCNRPATPPYLATKAAVTLRPERVEVQVQVLLSSIGYDRSAAIEFVKDRIKTVRATIQSAKKPIIRTAKFLREEGAVLETEFEKNLGYQPITTDYEIWLENKVEMEKATAAICAKYS